MKWIWWVLLKMPPHDYPYHWVILDPKSKDDKVKVTNFKNSPKFQIFEFWNGHYTRHTFWSCLIRCANMKWIQWVLLKIQSGDDSVHRRTDGQTDKVIPVYPPIYFVEAGGFKKGNQCYQNSDGIITPLVKIILCMIKECDFLICEKFSNTTTRLCNNLRVWLFSEKFH